VREREEKTLLSLPFHGRENKACWIVPRLKKGKKKPLSRHDGKERTMSLSVHPGVAEREKKRGGLARLRLPWDGRKVAPSIGPPHRGKKAAPSPRGVENGGELFGFPLREGRGKVGERDLLSLLNSTERGGKEKEKILSGGKEKRGKGEGAHFFYPYN